MYLNINKFRNIFLDKEYLLYQVMTIYSNIIALIVPKLKNKKI